MKNGPKEMPKKYDVVVVGFSVQAKEFSSFVGHPGFTAVKLGEAKPFLTTRPFPEVTMFVVLEDLLDSPLGKKLADLVCSREIALEKPHNVQTAAGIIRANLSAKIPTEQPYVVDPRKRTEREKLLKRQQVELDRRMVEDTMLGNTGRKLRDSLYYLVTSREV